MLNVRGSEVSDFLRCRLKHKLRWNDGWVPRKPNGKLFFGSMFHMFLETLYQTKDPDKAMESMKNYFEDTDKSLMLDNEMDELWEMASKIAENYLATWWENDQNWNVLATELRFEIPLDEEITFTGTMDIIFEDEDGFIRIGDHKTASSISSYEEKIEMDRQISRYMWALQQIQKGVGFVYDKNGNKHPATAFGKKLEGKDFGPFLYNIILKDWPEPPKVLKSGKLSEAKNQKTSLALYLKAIEELGQNVDDYQEIIQHLSDYPKEFFKRFDVHRLQPELDAAIQEFYYTSVDISGLRRHYELGKTEMAYRNITKDCKWDCDFKEACIASMDGSDVSYIFESMYTKEEK